MIRRHRISPLFPYPTLFGSISGPLPWLTPPFPPPAAAEPVAHSRNTGRVTVVDGGDWQAESPGPGHGVEPDRDAECYSHQANGSAGEKPGGVFAGEEGKPRQEKGNEQAGQGDDEEKK